jgi:PAS domain S-box-containing protein
MRQEPPVEAWEAISERLDARLERGIEGPFHDDVLNLLLEALASPHGCLAQLDELGDLTFLARRGLGEGSEPHYVSEPELGPWSGVLTTHKVRSLNEPHPFVLGGPIVQRAIATPILFGGATIGLLYAADKSHDYELSDGIRAVWIAKRLAPCLFAHQSQLRFRRQLAELEEMANAAAEGERFFMLSGDLMTILDQHLARVNPAFVRHLGWDSHELRERSLAELAHPADRDALTQDLADLRREPNRERPPIVVRMQAKSGEYLSIEWTGAATAEGRVYAVGRNVSELRSAVARLAAQNEELHVLHEQAQREQRLASHLLANVRKQGCLDIPGVRHLTTPLDFFNGDIALAAAAATEGGELRWLLGDFTGHGLSAAVGTIPIASTFYATSRKGVPLKESIDTINDLLKSLLPPGLFCAAAFLSLDVRAGVLTVWNGGLPAVVVRSAKDGSLRQHPSQSLPLGLVSSHELDAQPVVMAVAASDEVFVYSDGFTEGQNAAGEMFGSQRVLKTLAEVHGPGEGFDSLVRELESFRGVVKPADDVSLVVVTVGAVEIPAITSRVRP